MLTDMAIRNFRPGPKAAKLAEGGGLFLLVTPAGGKLWRFKYRMDGHERLLALACLIHEPAAHWCFGFGGSVAA